MPASKLHSSPEMHVIEHVQRNFTEILAGLQSLPYTERLKRLDLDSLDLRWLRADLVWCYKIIFGLVWLDVNDFFVLSTTSRTRGHAFKLFKARCSGIRATFFCERVINSWNNLPSNTDFSSLPAFKRFISNVDFAYCVKRYWFLANVNSRSRSLCAIARPSVCRLSVCRLSSVCNVRAPYSGNWNFRQYFCGIKYLGHPLTSTKILRRSSQGNPSAGGVEHKRGSKI